MTFLINFNQPKIFSKSKSFSKSKIFLTLSYFVTKEFGFFKQDNEDIINL